MSDKEALARVKIDRLKQLNAMAISQLRVLQQSNSRLLSEGRKD